MGVSSSGSPSRGLDLPIPMRDTGLAGEYLLQEEFSHELSGRRFSPRPDVSKEVQVGDGRPSNRSVGSQFAGGNPGAYRVTNREYPSNEVEGHERLVLARHDGHAVVGLVGLLSQAHRPVILIRAVPWCLKPWAA